MNLAELLHRSALYFKDKTALLWGGEGYSYQKLDELVGMVSAGLAALGVKPGDRVGIYLPNSPEFVLSYYGIVRLGGIAVCMNSSLKREEVRGICRDSGLVALITVKEMLAQVPPTTELPALRHLVVAGGGGDLSFQGLLASGSSGMGSEDMDRDSPAVILYTSATTGEAKGVVLSHGNLVSCAYSGVHHVGIKEEDRPICFVPLYHIFGQAFVLNTCLTAGATLILHQRFDMNEILESGEVNGPTIFYGVPTIYIMLMNLPGSLEHLKSVRIFLSGGAILLKEIAERWRDYSGRILYDSYGLSEACCVSFNHEYHYRPGSVGTPIENVEVRVADGQGQPVPYGQLGEVCIRGPNVMRGYYGRPEETARAIQNGWLRSGDIGRMDEDGYFYILDRVKDIIKTGGFTVYPREVEEVLFQHPAVKDAAVIGMPDPVYGETVQACVILKEGSRAKEQDIISFCTERIAGYKAPRSVVFLQAIPRSPSGKVLKKLMRAVAG